MTPTMLRSILAKTIRKEEDESWQDEKETDQLGLSLIEHCDTFDEKTHNTSKVKKISINNLLKSRNSYNLSPKVHYGES
jgi:hypothetical protein